MRLLSAIAALTAALLLLPPALPAAAHPVPHGDTTRIINLRPSAGAVVPAGEVLVAALAVADRPVTAHELRVDGQRVAANSTGGDHPTIAATVPVRAGTRTAELSVTTSAGTSTRTWRFHADDTAVARLSGTGRLETAVAISRDLYGPGERAAAAVLARAEDFPDALAGGPLAHALDAPLLLSGTGRLPDVTADELRRVLAPGATVHLLGGTAALSAQVLADVEALGLRAERIAGVSRFGTAAAIAERVLAAGNPTDPTATAEPAPAPTRDAAGEPVTTAIVASGEQFADALAVSAPAARDGVPILLTSAGALPADTRALLQDRGITDIIVVGGPGAVSPAVAASLAEIGTVERVSGDTRFATAAAIGARFYADADVVAMASALRFPDALAGGRHAAALGAPLALVDRTQVLPAQRAQIAALQPAAVVVYGGTAAVDGEVEQDVRRAKVSVGGPGLVEFTPSAAEVQTLDEIALRFDRDVFLPASDVQVVIDGTEAPGVLRHGDFATDLVFTLSALPDLVRPRVAHTVEVTIAASDVATVQVLTRRFVLRQPPATLVRGDSGSEVADLQRRLRDAGFWVGAVDGAYGSLTHQAVMALQKTHGLSRDGVYGQATRALLESGPARPRPRSTSGRVYEVDLDRQILMIVVNGRVDWIINASTGHGRTYEFNGRTYRATTTTGRHTIRRQIDGLREAERGSLWRPKYYDDTRGIAIHGSTSIPATPESAGCIRVSYAAMDFIWSLDPGTGAGVWVYPEGHYG